MNCIFSNSDCNGALKYRMPLAAIEKSAVICEYHWTLRQQDVRVAASRDCTCWEGYERVPGTEPCESGSCRKKKRKSGVEAGKVQDFVRHLTNPITEQVDEAARRIEEWAEAPDGAAAKMDSAMTKIENGIAKGLKKRRAKNDSLIKALEDVIGNVFSMYVRTHGAHWNVRGSDFAQYHELFETIYSDVYDSIDALAENIRKLDADAPASLNEFADLDGLKEAPVSGDSEQVLVQDILDANRIVLESLTSAFDVANKSNEQGIANFLAERIDMHQKWKWQLSSSQEKTASVKCAACGNDDINCDGHTLDVDPVGYGILSSHKVDDHLSCNPDGCNYAGRSVHSHACFNCGQDATCTAKFSNATGCEERTTICANCAPKLARMEHLSFDMLDAIKKRMMQYNNRGQFDNLNDETIQAEMKGAPLDAARSELGDSRPGPEEKKKQKLKDRIIQPMLDRAGYPWKIPSDKIPFGGGFLQAASTDELPDWIEDAIFDDVRYASEESGDSFVPPQSVASAAKRGLELRRKHNRGGTEIGVARARDLSNRKGLSYSTVKRMKAYFDRHEVDKKGEGWGKDSAGYIAWLLWGGDSGRSWANKIVKQKEKEKKSSIEKEAISPDMMGVALHGIKPALDAVKEMPGSHLDPLIWGSAAAMGWAAIKSRGELKKHRKQLDAEQDAKTRGQGAAEEDPSGEVN